MKTNIAEVNDGYCKNSRNKTFTKEGYKIATIETVKGLN